MKSYRIVSLCMVLVGVSSSATENLTKKTTSVEKFNPELTQNQLITQALWSSSWLIDNQLHMYLSFLGMDIGETELTSTSTGMTLTNPIPGWIGTLVNDSETIYCSANLISPSWVLTAKHCGPKTGGNWVRLGYYSKRSIDFVRQQIRTEYAHTIQVKVFSQYPMIQIDETDLRLIRIKPLTQIKPITLIDYQAEFFNDNARLFSAGLPENNLSELPLSLISEPTDEFKTGCDHHGIYENAELYFWSAHGVACKGDSGGGVLQESGGEDVMIGVLSSLCDQGYGIIQGFNAVTCDDRSNHMKVQQLDSSQIEELCRVIEKVTQDPSNWPSVCLK